MKIKKVNEIGEVFIEFSEELISLKRAGNFNYTILHLYDMLEVSYETDNDENQKPYLAKWECVDFSEYDWKLKLTFENYQKVSKGIDLDTIRISFTHPNLFRSFKDGIFI